MTSVLGLYTRTGWSEVGQFIEVLSIPAAVGCSLQPKRMLDKDQALINESLHALWSFDSPEEICPCSHVERPLFALVCFSLTFCRFKVEGTVELCPGSSVPVFLKCKRLT